MIKNIKLGGISFVVLAIVSACQPVIPINNLNIENAFTNISKSQNIISGKVEFPESKSLSGLKISSLKTENSKRGKLLITSSKQLQKWDAKRKKGSLKHSRKRFTKNKSPKGAPVSFNSEAELRSILKTNKISIPGKIRKPENSKFKTQAVFSDIVQRATVSLLYPPEHPTSANVAVATGLTDNNGNFAINPNINGFKYSVGEVFILEATKRIGTSGNAIMSLRTYIRWNGSLWESMTTPGIFINTKTTALAIIDSYDNSISSGQTIKTITVSGNNSTPSDIGSATKDKILYVSDLVKALLEDNLDPFQHIDFQNNFYVVNRITNTSLSKLIASKDCPSCSLKYEDLSSKNFSNSNLANANLFGANLGNVNFSSADLSGTNLNFTNLTGANFTGTNLPGTDFSNATIDIPNELDCEPGSIGNCKLGETGTDENFYQEQPDIAIDNSGNYVIVWEGEGNGDDYGVFGQRYNFLGATQGSEFRVNTYTANDQDSQSVAMDNSGNFVVVWESSSQDGNDNEVYAQRYNSSGLAAGSEFRVNTYVTKNQNNPSVAMDDNGNFVVVWESFSQDGDYFGIFGQRYNSSGLAVGSEFKINSYTTDAQVYPSVAMDSNGNFVVAWQDGYYNYDTEIGYYGIYAQRYNSSGIPQGSEFSVNTTTEGSQEDSDLAMDSNGNFVITWDSESQDGSSWGVYAQRFDSAGNMQGSEFLVNTYTNGDQSVPSIGMDSNGDFVIAWDSEGQDGSSWGVYAQRFDSAGNTQGSEFLVNSLTFSPQINAAVVMDQTGNFIVSWQTYTPYAGDAPDYEIENIFTQRYKANGEHL